MAAITGANFASNKDIRGQLGYLFALVHGVVHHISDKSPRDAKDVLPAELYAFTTARDAANAMRATFNVFLGEMSK